MDPEERHQEAERLRDERELRREGTNQAANLFVAGFVVVLIVGLIIYALV